MSNTVIRQNIRIKGAVQGVGFRPFIYKLAHLHQLTGWIINSPSGVELEVQGGRKDVSQFMEQLPEQIPPLAKIRSLVHTEINLQDEEQFTIRPSKRTGGISALVLPDIATCSDCMDDVFDPANRRYLYPFTNCTNCGPRYSIIEKLPYDRPFTAMKHFPMCAECLEEYENPLDRRFHAQPNACPICGPHIELLNAGGKHISEKDRAIEDCVALLKKGQVIALKGIGGFQLLVDAANEEAVNLLRKRKNRKTKPFAMMAPDCPAIEKTIALDPLERQWLESRQAPIVLVEKTTRHFKGIAPAVSGATPTLGFMLPYSPLHHILMRQFGGIVVATSGNLSEEPICISEEEALSRLSDICDAFLIHNRPIIRPVDDSVMRIVNQREMLIRRSRGFAPFPIETKGVKPNQLALGAHLKNTIALSQDGASFISQHIGDLETLATRRCFEQTITDLTTMYQFKPERTLTDLHPEYYSSRYISDRHNTRQIQHHYAHVLACMAENELEGDVLGIAWDGTGLGTDGTIWGGEFFICDRLEFTRFASLYPFLLPGGDKAALEPRRTGLSLLWEAFEKGNIPNLTTFTKPEEEMIISMLNKKLNCMETTSAGRLFDGLSSLLGLCHINGHEGLAPQALELQARLAEEVEPFHMPIIAAPDRLLLDWRPMIIDLMSKTPTPEDSPMRVSNLAAGLHHALANGIGALADKAGCENICLTGGCFQNRFLSELTIQLLEGKGYNVFWHRQIPPNDGGISAGQLYFNG